MDNWNNEKELNFKFELNKSIFLIDILADYYEFGSVCRNGKKIILIFEKINRIPYVPTQQEIKDPTYIRRQTLKKEVSINNLIYFVQIELPKIYPFLNLRKSWEIRDHENVDLITRYQTCFGDIDTIKKLIDNIKYTSWC